MHLRTLFLFLLLAVPAGSALAGEPLSYLNRILGVTEQEIEKNYQRLSGGRYLLPDDPANQAIYELLESHIRQLDRQIANDRDMLSYYRTMDGYLAHIGEVLQNTRTLLLKRSNAIYSAEDREYIDLEIGHCYEQIRFILTNAEFNKKRIFQDLLAEPLLEGWFRKESYSRLDTVDRLIEFFLSQRAACGARTSALESRIGGRAIERENETRFQSGIGDVRMSEEIALLKRNHLLFLANLLMLGRSIGADSPRPEKISQ